MANIDPSPAESVHGRPATDRATRLPIWQPDTLEVVYGLSRLRWLSIIARGSAFQFQSGSENAETIAQVLAVRYCLTGTVEFSGKLLSVMVELADSQCGRVIWADRFHGRIDDIHEVVRVDDAAAALLRIAAHELREMEMRRHARGRVEEPRAQLLARTSRVSLVTREEKRQRDNG